MYAYIFRERERQLKCSFFCVSNLPPKKHRSFRVASGSVSTFGSTFWTGGTCRCAIWTLRDGAWHIWANASRRFIFCFHFFITVIKQFLPNLIIFTTPSTGPKDIWKLQSQHATLQEEATAQADGLFTVQIFFLQWQSAQSSCVFVTFQSTIPCWTGGTNATTKQGHETRWHQSVGWMIQWRIQYINIISGFTAAAEFLKFGLLQQTSHLVLHTGTDPRKISGTTHQHHLTKQVADVFLCVLALGLWLNKNQWFLTCAKVYCGAMSSRLAKNSAKLPRLACVEVWLSGISGYCTSCAIGGAKARQLWYVGGFCGILGFEPLCNFATCFSQLPSLKLT